ncbi:myosin-VIIa [Drosophila grimshawi]|uniref:GH11707 n=1 Tax=Drosophila grimshawi TaxID=7222 RepID=B4JD29_DROGR|nr:myosin-VIIa [Drosophila grimshawi]EDW04273.1 GH11707 [Drosophila grimshawi]
MSEFVREHGEYVWVKPQNTNCEFAVPFGARIVRTEKTQTLVCDDDKKQFWVPAGDVLKAMHVTSQEDVDDMITLGDLQEYTILRNLKTRYAKQLIYTYTGSMLVAINPYQILPIYTHREIQLYRDKKLSDLPPHIFAISDNAFQRLQRHKENQCVVISGESGAGKTESTKLILQYLAAISGKHSWIEQQIIEANPIMEAFGNAKTVRNDNSSRFGKYIDIRFTPQGAIQGARIQQYLLEKSRIVFQSREERNYHIFYCMLAGLSTAERERLQLLESSASQYNYLAQGGCFSLAGKEDANDFADIRAAMKVLSFKPDEVWCIFSLLAAILHLGNLRFKAIEVANLEAAEVDDPLNLQRAAQLLGLDTAPLNTALTQRTIFVHGEHVVTSLSKEAALEGRDAFVKSLYDGIFVRIVRRINETINIQPKESVNSIGVLDIFGFENFDNNSFEQLCINYANEKLQQFFVGHIFKMEQAEYQLEHINWQHIEFQDNQDILDLIGMKPVNIMSLIDEESKFPKGTDNTLLEKLHVQHGNRSIYVKGKTTQTSLFGIRHYAGVVMYNPLGFLEKNRDSFSGDLRSLVQRSSNKYLVDLCPNEITMDTAKKQPTLCVKFRNSLDMLMRTLSQAHPYFIRCIKPNEYKESNNFDKELCVRQLRYSGMMETARIRRAGYPIRHAYRAFVERYRLLVPKTGPLDKCDCRQLARQICEATLPVDSNRQFGKTKLFLRDDDDVLLETERSRRMLQCIVTIQRGFRRVLFRRYLQKYRQAIVTVQRHWRGRVQRRRYEIMRNGFHRLGACLMAQQLTTKFTMVRSRSIKLQALCRGYLARKRFALELQQKRLREKQLKVLRQQEQAEKQLQMKLLREQHLKQQAEQDQLRLKQQEQQRLRQQQAEQEQLRPQAEAAARNALAMAAVQQPKRTKSLKRAEQPQVVIRAAPVLPAPTLQARMSLPPPPPMSPIITTPLNSAGYIDVESSKQMVDDVFGFLNDEPDLSLKKSNSISSGGTIRLPKTIPNNVDTSDFSFQKYASTYFHSGINSQHERKPLKQTLLKHELPVDQMAGKAIWLLTLRFMGDLPEAAPTPTNHSLRYPELMQDLAKILGSKPRRFIRQTIKRQSKLIGNGQREAEEFYQLWLNAGSSHLDKLHFIIGHGILKEGLRDEILAQICKQLYLNPSRSSSSRGWLLLSLCLTCFPPSSNFEPYLRSYMKMGTAKLQASSSLQHLERTLANGARSQPPSLLELQAIRSRQPLKLAIHLMDGQVLKLQVDAASTAREAVQQLCDRLQLVDSFGFGLVLALHEKLLPLGAGREHVLDAISSCEQRQLPDANWKLYLRKELFSAWYDPAQDAHATQLIYKQIIVGLKCGEYRCRSEKDIAMVCALATYIEFGGANVASLTSKELTAFVPRDLLAPGERAVNNWSRLIAATYEKSAYVRGGQDVASQQRAKEDICLFAHLSWPMRHCRLYEVVRLSGPQLQSDDLMLAINAVGLSLIDETEQVLASCSYAELLEIHFHGKDELHLLTAQQENFVLQSSEARDAAELIDFMLSNLKQRSSYGIAIENSQKQQQQDEDEQQEQLLFKAGDLVEFEAGVSGAQIQGDNAQLLWRGCVNGKWGQFAASQVRILATLTKPRLQLLQIFKDQGQLEQQPSAVNSATAEPQRRQQHSLAQFAELQFRELLESEQSPLWRYSAEPLKAPLLRSLHSKPQLYQQALVIYHHILKYMGDIARGNLPVNTDLIFQPALQHSLLCDEVFCQLMKQLSRNPLAASEQRGWDLLYLATGIMVPTVCIMRELILFLRQRPDALADACLRRLKHTVQHGQRKQAPHQIEVEGIQQRCLHIYHKIYFPDDTVEAFEIESHTRGAELIAEIANRLELKSQLGFSIFMKIGEKVYAMPETDFVFDFITHLLHYLRQQKTIRSSCDENYHYQLHFMRKLWLDCQPGNDPNADVIFNYPQELHKYLKGYYAIDLELALQLVRLIYKASHEQGEGCLLHELLPRLIPEDLLPLQTLAEWHQQLLPLLNQDVGLDEDQVKLRFLQLLAQQTGFGSTFFSVKQLNDVSLPENLLIAINSTGFHLLDGNTKQLLRSNSYTELGIWSSGKNHFHIRFGNMIGASKLLCSTTQGYKMDDLLTSYMKYFNNHQLK